MSSKPKDELFAGTGAPEQFEFNESVAGVFDDMLERSVPLYRECLEMTVAWCLRFARDGSCIYDLGCSTGTFLSRLDKKLPSGSNIRLVGVDNSSPMLDRARSKLKGSRFPCELIESDLDDDFSLSGASVVVMNYTLQFIPPARRPALIESVYKGTFSGGCLVLIEKVRAEDPGQDEMFQEFHRRFKQERGYSNLEISQKREALENVLVPWKTSENIALLEEAGFKSVEMFFKWNNFAGFIALK